MQCDKIGAICSIDIVESCRVPNVPRFRNHVVHTRHMVSLLSCAVRKLKMPRARQSCGPADVNPSCKAREEEGGRPCWHPSVARLLRHYAWQMVLHGGDMFSASLVVRGAALLCREVLQCAPCQLLASLGLLGEDWTGVGP
jgi:hypothetical protein